MRIANMAETVLRTSLRTPNISQLSPTPSLSVSNTSISTHLSNTSYPSALQLSESPATTTTSTHSPGGSTQVTTAQRLQYLKQRKTELEKLLLEKNSFLQQLCRQEGQIIGCYDFDQPVDGKSSTLRRKVGTAFKLPENLLNGSADKEDEINKLLLGKQIQQQISEASLKLANDLSQTKSIRRTHKNNYENAQQKLNVINQSLSALKKRQNCDVVASTNVIGYQSQFKQPSPTTKIPSDTKYATNNNNFLHPASQLSPTQFNNNNFIGSASNNHQLLMKAYSTHGNISPNINNNQNSMMQRRNSMISNTSSTNLEVPAPTTPNARIRHEVFAVPFDYTGYQHVHYNNASNNNNKTDFSASVNSINQQKHLKKSALLDNDYNLQRYSPISCDTDTFNYHNHFNQYSPGDIITTTTTTPPDFGSSPHMGRLMMTNQMVDQDINQTRPFLIPINPRHDKTVYYQQMSTQQGGRKLVDGNVYNQRLDIAVDDSVTNDAWNGRLVISPPLTSKGTMIQQGLGGYWMNLENNERVWCSVDRFASLDRKGQSLKLRKQPPVTLQKQPAISTSLGNIEHISKQSIDEAADSLSISSMNSDQKKFKEKQWIETSLDCPVTKVNDQLHQTLMTPSPPPPTLHQREKKKLSSHSMHSPGRNNYLYTSPSNSMQHDKQLHQPCHSVLEKSFSHSVSTLAPTAKFLCQTPHEVFNQKSKPQPIPPKQPYPLPLHASNVLTNQLQQHQHRQFQPPQQLSPSRPPPQMQLRRTASSVSTTSTNLLNPTNIRVESPKNMTVVQPAKFQPYKEESKPFEMSDFYKYSTKFRQKNIDGDGGTEG